MTASHRFELQSETKDDHQQSRKLRKCLSRNRKGFYFKSLNLKKASSTKTINNRGNIIQLQKETAYLPPSCSLLRETKVNIYAVAIWPVTVKVLKTLNDRQSHIP